MDPWSQRATAMSDDRPAPQCKFFTCELLVWPNGDSNAADWFSQRRTYGLGFCSPAPVCFVSTHCVSGSAFRRRLGVLRAFSFPGMMRALNGAMGFVQSPIAMLSEE